MIVSILSKNASNRSSPFTRRRLRWRPLTEHALVTGADQGLGHRVSPDVMARRCPPPPAPPVPLPQEGRREKRTRFPLRPAWGRTDLREQVRWGPVLSRHGLAASRGATAEGVGEATERPGEPGDRDGLLCFRLASPLRQAVLAREDGGRERLSARDPTSPRTGADQLDRLHPSPARRSTIGGLYDHRPVAPLSALIPDGSVTRTRS